LTFFTGGAPLPAGPAEIVMLTAEVPSDAPYGAGHSVCITSVNINENGIPATGDAGVHLVALFGDSTGNEDYSGLDAQRAARVAVRLDSGFEAFPVTDPVVVADITGNGAISGLDAQRIAQAAVGLDPIEIPPVGQPLRLGKTLADQDQSTPLTLSQLKPPVTAAVVAAIHTFDCDASKSIHDLTYEIIDLPVDLLGMTRGRTIQIDIDAVGYGWFIDSTPWDHAEFSRSSDSADLTALPGGPADGRVDLFTVLLHEFAHVLGRGHEHEGVMHESLPLSTRRVWADESLLDDTADFGRSFHGSGLTPTLIDDYFAAT
jgi:hypothetical protein